MELTLTLEYPRNIVSIFRDNQCIGGWAELSEALSEFTRLVVSDRTHTYSIIYPRDEEFE